MEKEEIRERLAAEQVNDRPVFVYGTLMKGERAEHFMAEATYVGDGQLRDYGMYHLGTYPGIKPLADAVVPGELYLVSAAMVEKMDAYEEEGSLYDRKTVTVWLGEQPRTAEVYVYKKDVTGCPLLPQGWKARP